LLAVNWPISFQQPQWLWVMLTIPVLVAASLRFLRGIERTRRIAAIALRSIVIALLAIALARVEWIRRNDHVAVLFILDRSRSIPDDLQDTARRYVREVTAKANRDDRVGVVGFDGEAQVDVMPSRAGFDIVSFGLSNAPDRTDIAAGLRMAMAAFPDGFSRRIVLLTDGNQNIGDLAEEIRNAAANKVAVDVVPLEYQYANEVMFDRIVVPTHSGRDTKVPVRMILKSQRPTRAKVTLYHNGQQVQIADPVLNLSGGMQPDPFTVPLELHEGGVHRFEARVAPIDPKEDSIAENNQATAFTFVEAQGRVLVLGNNDSTDNGILVNALQREKVSVEYATAEAINLDLLKLQEYSVVILSNIPAETFNTEQHKALASYVRDFGGGLIMVGGDESFGAGGWIGSPVEEVSPVNFEIKQKRQMPRGALAIVMHSCEAPNGNYWGEKVAESAIETISSLDYIGVIAYSWTHGGANWEVPLQIAKDKPAIIATLRKMEIGDMPDFDTTMTIATRDLMKLKDASQRHMIIISDGDPAAPSPTTIKFMQDNRITCSTVGIGYGEHVYAERMKPIADATGGRYYAVKNPRRLPQIFIKEARVVKRALIDNREFHPLVSQFDELTPGLAAAGVPTLGGLVLTERKPDALVPIIRKGTDAGDEVEDPVLAHWNFEMGKMAVFTSGLWDRWGSDWAKWGNFGKFWGQVVRWAMHDHNAGSFDITTRLDGSRGKVVIEALNKDASYLNFLQIRGKLVQPSGDAKSLYLTQTGPGRYEADFDVNDHGNYLVSLTYTDPDNKAGMIKTGLSVPYSAEFREMGTNFGLLDEVAAKTNGRRLAMDPLKDDVFSRKGLPPAIARQPMWRFVIQWLLLPLFLLDVASRRLASTVATSVYVEVAVFAMVLATLYHPGWSWVSGIVWALIIAECVGWAIRWRAIGPTLAFFTASVRSLSGVGQRGAQSLSRLKGVREKVREDMDKPVATAQPEPPTSRTISLEPAAARKRKFDVGDEQAAKPATDLTESLGGAKAETPDTTSRPGRPGVAGGSLSDRLKKAKQRAQDQIKEQKDEE
jgi:uncharacterized membrane protein/Mg-chelatase subunit ChlD